MMWWACACSMLLLHADLFNGKNLDGWEHIAPNKTDQASVWSVQDGVLICNGHGGGWISTKDEHADFRFTVEFRLEDGANSGVYIRAPREGHISRVGIEIQILDDYSARYNDPKHPMYYNLKPTQRCGSVYGVVGPSGNALRPAGEWNRMTIQYVGSQIMIELNDQVIVNDDLSQHPDALKEHPGLTRTKGYIGLQSHNGKVEFRKVTLTPAGK